MSLERGEKGRIYTGARARLSVEGKIIGYARGVNGSETIEYDEAVTLDNIEIEEYVPIGYRVTFSCEMIRIVGDTLKSAGLFPNNGTNSAEHLTNILASGDLNAQLEDTKTGKIIAQLQQVKVQSYNFSVSARGIVGSNVDFVAIRMMDESEMTTP